MLPPHEIFDNEEVQWHTRKQAAQLTAVIIAIVSLTVVGAVAAWSELMSRSLVAGILVLSWAGGIAWIAPRRRRLRQVAWCLKLSPQGVITYDYARHQTSLTWANVQRIDLTAQGLVIAGPPSCSMVIPHLFPNFADLSHAIVHLAESHHIPIYIDGQPWDALDIISAFPFLEAVR